MTTKDFEYQAVMENLYREYEKSCILLEGRIAELSDEQSGYSSRSKEYAHLYNRIRRLKRCLDDTRAWQEMVYRYLLAGGMDDEKIRMLVK